MKFEKGMKEDLLWDYLHYNIFDDFNDLVDYSHLNFRDKWLKFYSGTLKQDVEIIVKINGKVMPDCWEEEK